MNNNKKILKRSSAAFLAALNIFNFAGGSSKAVICVDFIANYMKVYPNGDYQQIFKLGKLLDLLEGVDFADVNALNNSGDLEKIEGECIKDCVDFYNLKDKKVLFLDFCGDVSSQQGAILNSLKEQSQNLSLDNKFIIFKVESNVPTEQQSTIKNVLKNNTDFYFINVNTIKTLNLHCKTFEKFNDEKKKLKEDLETAKKDAETKINAATAAKEEELKQAKEEAIKAKEEAIKAKEANDKNAEYFYKRLVLDDLVKFLKEERQKGLNGDAESLTKVQGNFKFQSKFLGNAPFKLVGNNDRDFLGNVEFQYSKEKKVFSINELIKELNKDLNLASENEIANLKPIDLNSIKISQAKQATGENGDNKEEKEEVLDVNKYEEKLQQYINNLNGIIKAIGSMTKVYKELEDKIKVFESDEGEYEDRANAILGALGKTPGSSDTLGKQFDDIEQGISNLQTEKETAENNSKKADSKVIKLRVVAGLGWIGILVNLGYVFQNELKNACGTVYKKVLELKNKMLG